MASLCLKRLCSIQIFCSCSISLIFKESIWIFPFAHIAQSTGHRSPPASVRYSCELSFSKWFLCRQCCYIQKRNSVSFSFHFRQSPIANNRVDSSIRSLYTDVGIKKSQSPVCGGNGERLAIYYQQKKFPKMARTFVITSCSFQKLIRNLRISACELQRRRINVPRSTSHASIGHAFCKCSII